MTDQDRPGLGAAYALSSPEDNRKLYADWAGSYDTDFVQQMSYLLPHHVARAHARVIPAGRQEAPILDLGAGTGLVGEQLAAMGIGPIHGTDISPDMLSRAAAKSVYEDLFEGDLLARLPRPDARFGGAVSAGTFTHGHVGPDALPEVLRLVRAGGWVTLSVNAAHFETRGFAAKLSDLSSEITDIRMDDVPIYGPGAEGPHKDDRAVILQFRRV